MKLQSKNIKHEIFALVQDKIDYLLLFQETACLKKIYGQKEQYKTEKWLQAEIIYRLHKKYGKAFRIIPEFSSKKWDLLIEPVSNELKKGILLEMKCLSASKNSGDKKKVVQDIEKVAATYPDYKDYEKSYLLILPKRPSLYTEDILDTVRPLVDINMFEKAQKKIHSADKKNGVLFIWMDFK